MKTMFAALLFASATIAAAQSPTYSIQQVQPAPVTFSPSVSQASMTQLLNGFAIRQANQNALTASSLSLLQRPVVITAPAPAPAIKAPVVKSSK